MCQGGSSVLANWPRGIFECRRFHGFILESPILPPRVKGYRPPAWVSLTIVPRRDSQRNTTIPLASVDLSQLERHRPPNLAVSVPYKVFLSYSWLNMEEREALAREIAAIENVQVLVDDDFISPGQSIHSAILSMIDAADCLVVLLTMEGLKSREVLDEITRAHERRKLIIPIVPEGTTLDALPWYLRDSRRIRYDPKDFGAVIKSVVTEIGKLANLLESPHPTVLRILLGLSCLYWILTGPWPLLWLYTNPGPMCHDWWSTATSFPYLYFHSTCVGLFLTLCLRYPLGAMFASSVFRKPMWKTLSGLLILTLVFIVYDVKVDARDGSQLYGCDPSGFSLPLSSALQMFVFMLTTAVVILIGSRPIINLSRYTADRKVSNRLFGTILYGILWLPMRSAYEQVSPTARGLLHSDSQIAFSIVICMFIFAEGLLVFSVLYNQRRYADNQRRYAVPMGVIIVSAAVLLLTWVHPDVCKSLFRIGGLPYVYILICGLGLVAYVAMIPYESDRK